MEFSSFLKEKLNFKLNLPKISGVYINEMKNCIIRMNCPFVFTKSQNEIETETDQDFLSNFTL